jgi:manganese oxidase
MAVSYRSEPMVNREQTLWRLLRTGHVLDRPVLNEEQHHSSWMFGDPSDHLVVRAYIGDRVRIRFVHAAVKETHVFHLHLYEWHALPGDPTSPRIDAISISPQTGHTIEPVWGAGNRHQVAGDVIWHCHLYPHFHEGMWGIFRTFETRQDGEDGPDLDSADCIYAGRRIGRYPDGTRISKLLALPGNAPPEPTADRPGFPLYIPGRIRQKSPRPPWPDREFTDQECQDSNYRPPCEVVSLRGLDMPPDFDYRPFPTDLERLAFNELPVPGEMFTRNRIAKQQQTWEPQKLARNNSREVCHNLVVSQRRIDYNDHGWHDRHGHLYHLEADGDPAERPGPDEPLFFRAQHGQIVNMTLRNAVPETIEETEFDHAFPPCPALPWEGECAPHVHMVKFDPICADGASVGWNYMSGARIGRKMVYRWWADQEFGTIFFHDHLFANYRQKHGLFGALIVEPAGSTFFHHLEPDQEIVSGLQALIQRHPDDDKPTVDRWFREFCVGIADFIPMWDGQGRALNPPPYPGGHGDQGVMALNYRNAPLRERPGDPAFWFSSRVHGDPPTTVFQTYAHDPIWIRIVQGSHEESHSFQAHGLRWQRFRDNVESAVRNQQTTGIAEAFTFINRGPVRPGDYLYKLSGADDLWLGCWGLIRAHQRPAAKADRDLIALQPDPQIPAPPSPNLPKRTF